jgi:uncharacterized lipoprotein YmbA
VHFASRGRVVSVAWWFLWSGCSILQPRTDPTRYYVLTAVSSKTEAPPATRSIGIERISLPDYLARPELVRRTAENELKIADYEHWGEPLKDGFGRTLHEDLALLLGTDRVYDSPFDPSQVDFILDVDVIRFERVGENAADLDVRYALREGRSGNTIASRETHKHQPFSDHDTQQAVSALSKLIAAFAEEVAKAVRNAPLPSEKDLTER